MFKRLGYFLAVLSGLTIVSMAAAGQTDGADGVQALKDQRRQELRSALRAQRLNQNAAPGQRKLTPQERAELRQQLAKPLPDSPAVHP